MFGPWWINNFLKNFSPKRMSNHSKFLLKMNESLQTISACFTRVFHPAAGKEAVEKKKRRSSPVTLYPKATPDSQNIRGLFKKQDSFRRNPAP